MLLARGGTMKNLEAVAGNGLLDHHTRWKVCAARGFQGFTTYRPHRPQVPLWMRPEWSELRHATWAYRNPRDDYTRAASRMRRRCCCARAVTRSSWCLNAYLARSPEKGRAS